MDTSTSSATAFNPITDESILTATYYFRYRVFREEDWQWVSVRARYDNKKEAIEKARKRIISLHGTFDFLMLTDDKHVVIY